MPVADWVVRRQWLLQRRCHRGPAGPQAAPPGPCLRPGAGGRPGAAAVSTGPEGAGPDDYAELAQALQRELGRLDGLLVCAALPWLTPFELADPASFARAVHALTAPAWLAQACLPLRGSVKMRRWCLRSMLPNGWGRLTGAVMAWPSMAFVA